MAEQDEKQTSAAALMIGNELLTGKIRDENTPFLARQLFELGIPLRRVAICPDELDVISSELNALRNRYDIVFTSGGVGPTHDDITLDAVAHAFDRPLGRSAEMVQMIRAYHGDRTTEDHLRMANVPEGSTLIRSADVPWPTVQIENVYVLPGVPEIFRLKFQVIRPHLDRGLRFFSESVYTQCDEGEIADLLSELTKQHPEVQIGSYVRWGGGDYKVKITFDGTRESAVRAAANALHDRLPSELVVRRESGLLDARHEDSPVRP